uniref:AcidPPc domain-containing protein n=1 Tax=Trichuris muris TaxID=70415 RepID=A0A5S6Q7I6_TRIMR
MNQINSSLLSEPTVQRPAKSMTKTQVLRIALDLVILGGISLPILILKLAVSPYERGFYCDDESIRYPFKESTVSTTQLNLVAFPVPLLFIIVVEWFRITRYEPRRYGKATRLPLKLFSWNVHPLVVRLYFFIGYFLCGAAASQLFTDIGKYMIGRLRPHFLDVCKPNVGYTTCSGHIYIAEFTCDASDIHRLKDARLSFPSGHSSLSAYAMLFAAIYLQSRLSWRVGSRLVKPLIQYLLLCITFAIALSRVSDFKHHWSDVLTGLVIGSAIAVLLTVYVMKIFQLEGKCFPYCSHDHLAAKETVNMNELQQPLISRHCCYGAATRSGQPCDYACTEVRHGESSSSVQHDKIGYDG